MNRRHFLAGAAAVGLAGNYVQAIEPRRPWRVAVIGHKRRGDYGHGLDTMWRQLPETTVVAVANPDADALAASTNALGAEQGFADYRQMLDKVRPELVSIGMRHVDQHRDAALAAVAAGARGIYMEKPFCRTPAEADEIVAACDSRGVKLALAHRNRYHPALAKVAQLVADGEIGQLLEIRARGKEDARGGGLDLWVLGSHLLNLVAYLGGAPTACSASVWQDDHLATPADVFDGAEGIGPLVGTRVHARYDLPSGVPAYFDSIKGAGNAAAGFGLQLIGTQGTIDLRIDREPLAHLVPGSPFTPTAEPRAWLPISSVGVGQPEADPTIGKQVMGHLVAARDLMASIEADRAPLCSAEDGRLTVEMIAAVFASHRQSSARVNLPLAQRGNPLADWA